MILLLSGDQDGESSAVELVRAVGLVPSLFITQIPLFDAIFVKAILVPSGDQEG